MTTEKFQMITDYDYTSPSNCYAILLRVNDSLTWELDNLASSEERVLLQRLMAKTIILSDTQFVVTCTLLQSRTTALFPYNSARAIPLGTVSSGEGYYSAALSGEFSYQELQTKMAFQAPNNVQPFQANINVSYTPPKRLKKSFRSTEQDEDTPSKFYSLVYLIMFSTNTIATTPTIITREFSELKFSRDESLKNLFT